ncbi:MAG: InlB B-repeat-containing protein, partial [Faecalibacterium sp.]|nr:InlB B-repeat-containing protein [Faecalibacterium sp.]MDY5503662.1 InlB B-repeat-containing protein [Faecalibacterium sp.]
MKQKKQNRILAALLAVAMMFQMLPMMAFAAEDTPLANGQAKIGDTVYNSVKDAVEAAPADGSTTTITLGEGEYTLYGTEVTADKNLTFVGQGAGLTTWNIGYPDSDQGSQNNADFSFKGSKTITFQNMTLKAGPSYNYQGFAHTDTTVVENCVVEGMTFYWGYNSATFKDTTFKPGGYKYALWTYCSEDTIFNHCKFECAGKAIYVHNEGNPLIKIHFKDCEVTNSWAKSALSVDDGPCSFKIYISGDNKVSAKRDINTCSKVYGFASNNGNTEVYYGEENENPELVWKDGKMVTHKHSDGEKDNAYTIDPDSEWENKGDHFERDVTKTCDYCKRQFPNVTEKGYQLSYDLSDGVAAEGADYTDKIVAENETVTLAAAPTKEGYFFHYWDGAEGNFYGDSATIKMTANTKLTAQWGEEPPEVP